MLTHSSIVFDQFSSSGTILQIEPTHDGHFVVLTQNNKKMDKISLVDAQGKTTRSYKSKEIQTFVMISDYELAVPLLNPARVILLDFRIKGKGLTRELDFSVEK